MLLNLHIFCCQSTDTKLKTVLTTATLPHRVSLLKNEKKTNKRKKRMPLAQPHKSLVQNIIPLQVCIFLLHNEGLLQLRITSSTVTGLYYKHIKCLMKRFYLLTYCTCDDLRFKEQFMRLEKRGILAIHTKLEVLY